MTLLIVKVANIARVTNNGPRRKTNQTRIASADNGGVGAINGVACKANKVLTLPVKSVLIA